MTCMYINLCKCSIPFKTFDLTFKTQNAVLNVLICQNERNIIKTLFLMQHVHFVVLPCNIKQHWCQMSAILDKRLLHEMLRSFGQRLILKKLLFLLCIASVKLFLNI